jgi:hypothetical protein
MYRKLIYLIALACLPAFGAAAQDDTGGTAAITWPAEGDTLSGSVQITGTVEHHEFASYQLDFATADQPDDWLSIQGATSQKVTEGVLGLWDTSSLPNGVYRLRLLVNLRSGDTFETVVESLEVDNTRPTDVPTVAPPPTERPTLPPPTPGPSPTPVIWQPPTVTPRPGIDSAGGQGSGTGASAESLGGGEGQLDNSKIRAAVCNGAALTLALVGLAALYIVVRPSILPWLRRYFRRR